MRNAAQPSCIGLSLSGGGSRAIAFHLGCLRALHDRGVLNRVSVLSSVSGGSVIAALWAYSNGPFEEFEARVTELLRRGMVWGIARQTFFSSETPRIISTMLTAGILARTGVLLGWGASLAAMLGADGKQAARFAKNVQAPLRRRASRTTAFERHLRSLYGDLSVTDVRRPNLAVVINAAELRTGTAFRFGSRDSGCWRFGKVDGRTIRVSMAVAASAAYPLFLPALDEEFEFTRKSNTKRERVILTDGGVYDNLGITCLVPGRSPEHSIAAFDTDVIICCDAGQGQWTGADVPYTIGSRLKATFAATHRRTHSTSYDLLHRLAASGEIRGFVLPYLGQIDARVLNAPTDLIPRDAVINYPTDFNPMPQNAIELLSARGEQLTRALIELHQPNL